ncbi:DUF5590 domain-containing protein [Bacillaceae bacterium Marseille-Q3522]|nr:DUF5590 domain-containing protein [Bacillaceae bacterium Marseille-Q3522]
MRKKIIIIAFITLAVFTGIAVNLYLRAVAPVHAAEQKAREIAAQQTSLQKIERFTLYNGSETYYVLEGKDESGDDIIAWIPENEGDITEKNASDGITEQEAVDELLQEADPEEIVDIRLGMENNTPLWEIYYRTGDNLMNYYYVNFETGEKVKDIRNL